MRLLEQHRNRRKPPRSAGEMTVVGIVVITFVVLLAISIVAGVIALAVWLLRDVPWV